MGASVFAMAQRRRGLSRAAFWRQIGFPNVKLANKARRETWKRYHELLAKFPDLRAQQALLLARKDHFGQYEALMHGTTPPLPRSSMQGEEVFKPFGTSSIAGTMGADSAPDRLSAQASPVADRPDWWERISGFEALVLALDKEFNDGRERTAAVTKMLLYSERAARSAANRHLARAERLKRERLKLKVDAGAARYRIAAIQAELSRLRWAVERGALVLTAQQYRVIAPRIAPRIKKRIRDAFIMERPY